MACSYNTQSLIRLSSRLLAISLSLAGFVFSVGCAKTKSASRPTNKSDLTYLEKHFEDQTPSFVTPGSLDSVVLIHDDQTRTIGSGTVIAPDRVLTAAHVVSGLTRDERGRLPIRIDTEVLLVGYAAGFFPDMKMDVNAPTPCVHVRIRETSNKQPVWYAIGDAFELNGMPGGAAMIWNYEIQRPEIIGIFRGYVLTETVATEQTRIVGAVTSVLETKKPAVALMFHRLPAAVRNPSAAMPPN